MIIHLSRGVEGGRSGGRVSDNGIIREAWLGDSRVTCLLEIFKVRIEFNGMCYNNYKINLMI